MKNTIKKTGKFLALGCTFGALLFTSCTDDNVVSDVEENQEVKTLEIALKAPTGTPIIIDDLGVTTLQTEKSSNATKGRYNITLKYLLPPTPRQAEVFEAAAARWERIIIKDVPDVGGPIPSAFEGFPDIDSVDDLVIEVALAPIDGPGGILGQAGPQFVRTEDFLSLTGVMFFDVEDLDFLEEIDLFEEVIVHEMGHVLGIGTLWNTAPFGFDRTLRAGPDSNPYFTGKKANVFWNAEGGTNELPIENMGGPGTALGHWREATLNNELMTGFLNLGENPLSRITAGSMRDLGYGSASVGESYDLPRGTEGVDINDLGDFGTAENQGLNIAKMEVLLGVRGFVNAKK
ncbi:leishmanolysin-related zinc metalloendopeptidase [Maribacter sp. BPC-D8]|uniref:leishmanolysin-related zinc metalloendopeptidase n=1 Tax=Maribacter sp. BPC-D8 TaxID=3053613 RepID=UPI002B48D294|nr:leishmanolysin-related zinc metalloendopeptidase [Maribacter sp. BPC-D8]WRI30628.1 leishmanolysin-related zinc metalloendopeptidase [Maribacter sp. BPC-D8]